MNYVDLPPGISLFFKTLNVISPSFPGGGVVDGRFEPHISNVLCCIVTAWTSCVQNVVIVTYTQEGSAKFLDTKSN